jgi:hypothetical protein
MLAGFYFGHNNFNVFLPIKKPLIKRVLSLQAILLAGFFYMRREQRQWELKLTIKASRGLVPRARQIGPPTMRMKSGKSLAFMPLVKRTGRTLNAGA